MLGVTRLAQGAIIKGGASHKAERSLITSHPLEVGAAH